MKNKTITLEDEQIAWLDSWGGNASELIRQLIATHIQKSTKSDSLEKAIADDDSERGWDVEYARLQKAYTELPHEIRMEVFRTAQAQKGEAMRKMRYSSREWWMEVYKTAVEMKVIA